MGFVFAGDILFPERHVQLFAVIGEDVDDVAGLVDQPESFLAIVRTHANAVGARSVCSFEKMIPLIPHF